MIAYVMAQLLVRGVPEEIAAALKKRAKKHGRSMEAEHRALLQESLAPNKTDAWAEIDRARSQLEESGRDFGDSTKDVRADRDRR
jgi:plasmid stability protein